MNSGENLEIIRFSVESTGIQLNPTESNQSNGILCDQMETTWIPVETYERTSMKFKMPNNYNSI